MEDELLIELVRNYPALYDLSNQKYMDSNFKQDTWKKIKEEMKVDGKCRGRFSNLATVVVDVVCASSAGFSYFLMKL